jgi:hypothetical protein
VTTRFVHGRLLMRGVTALGMAAGLGIAGTVVVDAAPPTPPTSLSQIGLGLIKTNCNIAVQRRLAVLAADETFVNPSAVLTSSDQSALEHQISADEQGLTALDATIQGDTTDSKAWTDCQRIVTAYRVYVLEDPKVHEVIAADGVTKVNATFTQVIPALQALINTTSLGAAVQAQAQHELNDLTSNVNGSRAAMSGVSASVISLLPAGWPANIPALQRAAAHLKTAGADLAVAGTDANQIVALLDS